jgi:hypothetical protein
VLPTGRLGEGFRMAASDDRSSGCEPAYGNPPMHEPAGSGAASMGIYERGGGEGSRMIAGLPLAFDAERRGRAAKAPVEHGPSVRRADVVRAGMAAELAVGLNMPSPDRRSGTASTRDCARPRPKRPSARAGSCMGAKLS